MTSLTEKRLAIVVIILSTIVMQMHSIPFWQKFIRNDLGGIALSVALEGAMLWLWYKNLGPVIRLVIAFLLISGPWYQVSTPVFTMIVTVSTSVALTESYRDEVEQLEGSLKDYQENSKKYRRSAERIEPTEARLDAAMAKYREALKEKGKAEKDGAGWRLYGVTAMLLLGFFAVLRTQIYAIVSLQVKCVSIKPETVQESVSEISSLVETVERVAEMIRAELPKFTSQNAFAVAYGFSPRDVSNVLRGKPVSRNKLEEMAERLGVE